MKETPSYYAVIPANVRYDKRLPPAARLLYGEITALCSKEGYCWASNGYLAELYDVGAGTVCGWIAQLVEYGYITSEVSRQDGNSRKLRIADPIRKKPERYRKKAGDPSPEKAGHITPSISTTSNGAETATPDKPKPRDVTDLYWTAHEKRYGMKPQWKAQYADFAKRLLCNSPLPFIDSCIQAYFDDSKRFWFCKDGQRDFGKFFQHFDAIATSGPCTALKEPEEIRIVKEKDWRR